MSTTTLVSSQSEHEYGTKWQWIQLPVVANFIRESVLGWMCCATAHVLRMQCERWVVAHLSQQTAEAVLSHVTAKWRKDGVSDDPMWQAMHHRYFDDDNQSSSSSSSCRIDWNKATILGVKMDSRHVVIVFMYNKQHVLIEITRHGRLTMAIVLSDGKTRHTYVTWNARPSIVTFCVASTSFNPLDTWLRPVATRARMHDYDCLLVYSRAAHRKQYRILCFDAASFQWIRQHETDLPACMAYTSADRNHVLSPRWSLFRTKTEGAVRVSVPSWLIDANEDSVVENNTDKTVETYRQAIYDTWRDSHATRPDRPYEFGDALSNRHRVSMPRERLAQVVEVDNPLAWRAHVTTVVRALPGLDYLHFPVHDPFVCGTTERLILTTEMRRVFPLQPARRRRRRLHRQHRNQRKMKRVQVGSSSKDDAATTTSHNVQFVWSMVVGVDQITVHQANILCMKSNMTGCIKPNYVWFTQEDNDSRGNLARIAAAHARDPIASHRRVWQVDPQGFSTAGTTGESHNGGNKTYAVRGSTGEVRVTMTNLQTQQTRLDVSITPEGHLTVLHAERNAVGPHGGLLVYKAVVSAVDGCPCVAVLELDPGKSGGDPGSLVHENCLEGDGCLVALKFRTNRAWVHCVYRMPAYNKCSGVPAGTCVNTAMYISKTTSSSLCNTCVGRSTATSSSSSSSKVVGNGEPAWRIPFESFVQDVAGKSMISQTPHVYKTGGYLSEPAYNARPSRCNEKGWYFFYTFDAAIMYGHDYAPSFSPRILTTAPPSVATVATKILQAKTMVSVSNALIPTLVSLNPWAHISTSIVRVILERVSAVVDHAVMKSRPSAPPLDPPSTNPSAAASSAASTLATAAAAAAAACADYHDHRYPLPPVIPAGTIGPSSSRASTNVTCSTTVSTATTTTTATQDYDLITALRTLPSAPTMDPTVSLHLSPRDDTSSNQPLLRRRTRHLSV